MPSGFLINVTEHSIQLWNFDDQQDKKRLRCKLESEVQFVNTEGVMNVSFNDKQNLLIIFHRNYSISTIKLGKLQAHYHSLLLDEPITTLKSTNCGPQLT